MLDFHVNLDFEIHKKSTEKFVNKRNQFFQILKLVSKHKEKGGESLEMKVKQEFSVRCAISIREPQLKFTSYKIKETNHKIFKLNEDKENLKCNI